ncbi:MAG: tetratricopeptide repeat protein [Rhodoferax sp.]|nr:tetratricopeptide repeat protein [Rhodoferax sp.]
MVIDERLVAELEELYFKGAFPELESRAKALVDIHPDVGLAWSILGAALAGQGKDALSALSRATELLPGDPSALMSYGDALFQAEQFQSARDTYLRALELAPSYAPLHNNLGNVYKDLGQLEEAESHYRTAVDLQPDFYQASFNLAVLLRETGRLEQAESMLRQALTIAPDFPHALIELGTLLKDKGQLSESATLLKTAARLSPQTPQAHINLGATYIAMGRFDDAVRVLRQATVDFPSLPGAHANLGEALYELKQFSEAKQSLSRALELLPEDPSVLRHIGRVELALGNRDVGLAHLKKALALNPRNLQLHSVILFTISQTCAYPAQQAYQEHCAYGRAVESSVTPTTWACPGVGAASRPLRIGFVSGDMNGHIAGRCFEPILAHLVQHSDLTVIGYYTNPQGVDHSALRIQQLFSVWRSVSRLSDLQFAQKVIDDKVDVLIDLSGHTEHHRLGALALKPAPIQVSWLGYPWTTGLTAIDYYLADKKWLPLGEFDAMFVEKLVHIPAVAQFLPFEPSPAVNALPCVTSGHFTFGSFNNFSKLSPHLIGVWASIMLRVPGSQMLIGAISGEDAQNTLKQWFQDKGIDPSRLRFAPFLPGSEFLSLYHDVDLCLDTFPYSGGTTNYHGLWMGVPTVTLAGDTPPTRVGNTALGHLGLSEFIARNANEYQEIAVRWANHANALANLRATLRQRFPQAAVTQHRRVANALHDALRTMWQRHCEGLRPSAFEVDNP